MGKHMRKDHTGFLGDSEEWERHLPPQPEFVPG